MLDIRADDLSHPLMRALLALHLKDMHAQSPPGTVFALDLSALSSPSVQVWSGWHGERVACIGALKRLSPGQGEIKSMRTHPDFLRQGAAAAMLEHIIAQARATGMSCLSLETGRGQAFEPALALYRRRGFVSGAPFADYQASDFNQFLHLAL
ncbi:GNAT family N-acetyltransferase [Oleiagrimonas sp. C23AA]|uniref:GNAT family N-acetyltransferase n=1 Tax=Oleiagrimonas sp. C23AA TaxID=2719047 RepID=UPI00141E5958|nr:GNAT family N-acetyltransferase [Oleiagrimonas sp. C23AA]NII09542.1 GNAT family N-acetyltransferase [Oleiagrimonas sp. C23AA]